MNDVTIFHNPACGTSRNTLALLRHAGIEPTVIEYLETPPSTEELKALIAAMGKLPPFTKEDGEVVHDSGERLA